MRSTVVPGTTEERIKPILEESGLKAGDDFYLAYSSEPIAEGRAFEEFISMPLARRCQWASVEKAKQVLSFVTKAEITVSDIMTVETAEMIENIQRDVNIAMCRSLQIRGESRHRHVRIDQSREHAPSLAPSVTTVARPAAVRTTLTTGLAHVARLHAPVPTVDAFAQEVGVTGMDGRTPRSCGRRHPRRL